MNGMTKVQKIEFKLANGVQKYTPKEVAHLLNVIRIQEEYIKVMGEK